jgi:hypothetical protein
MLSQECDVMVEPSAEASRPTMMLVQDSSGSGPAEEAIPLDATPVQLTDSKTRVNSAEIRRDHFLTGILLFRYPALLIAQVEVGSKNGRSPSGNRPPLQINPANIPFSKVN